MTSSMMADVEVRPVRTRTGSAYRARIEARLDKAESEMLTDLWQEVFPYPVAELPERQALIEDLADFAEVLQPRLADMRADQLCGLIGKYAARRRRQQNFVRSLACGTDACEAAEVAAVTRVDRRRNTQQLRQEQHVGTLARLVN